MAVADLFGFLDDDSVAVPIPGGKTYRVPSPDAVTGLRLTAIVNLGVQAALGGKVTAEDAAKLKLDDDQEREFLPMVLGSAYDEMLADGVSWVRIQRVGQYCLLYFTLGPDAAAQSVTQGEAPAPNRETRRGKKGSRQGSSAPDRSPTRRRASTAATTSLPEPKAV